MTFGDAASSVATPAESLVEALAEILRHEAVHERVNAAAKDTPVSESLQTCLVLCGNVSAEMGLTSTITVTRLAGHIACTCK